MKLTKKEKEYIYNKVMESDPQVQKEWDEFELHNIASRRSTKWIIRSVLENKIKDKWRYFGHS